MASPVLKASGSVQGVGSFEQGVTLEPGETVFLSINHSSPPTADENPSVTSDGGVTWSKLGLQTYGKVDHLDVETSPVSVTHDRDGNHTSVTSFSIPLVSLTPGVAKILSIVQVAPTDTDVSLELAITSTNGVTWERLGGTVSGPNDGFGKNYGTAIWRASAVLSPGTTDVQVAQPAGAGLPAVSNWRWSLDDVSNVDESDLVVQEASADGYDDGTLNGLQVTFPSLPPLARSGTFAALFVATSGTVDPGSEGYTVSYDSGGDVLFPALQTWWSGSPLEGASFGGSPLVFNSAAIVVLELRRAPRAVVSGTDPAAVSLWQASSVSASTPVILRAETSFPGTPDTIATDTVSTFDGTHFFKTGGSFTVDNVILIPNVRTFVVLEQMADTGAAQATDSPTVEGTGVGWTKIQGIRDDAISGGGVGFRAVSVWMADQVTEQTAISLSVSADSSTLQWEVTFVHVSGIDLTDPIGLVTGAADIVLAANGLTVTFPSSPASTSGALVGIYQVKDDDTFGSFVVEDSDTGWDEYEPALHWRADPDPNDDWSSTTGNGATDGIPKIAILVELNVAILPAPGDWSYDVVAWTGLDPNNPVTQTTFSSAEGGSLVVSHSSSPATESAAFSAFGAPTASADFASVASWSTLSDHGGPRLTTMWKPAPSQSVSDSAVLATSTIGLQLLDSEVGGAVTDSVTIPSVGVLRGTLLVLSVLLRNPTDDLDSEGGAVGAYDPEGLLVVATPPDDVVFKFVGEVAYGPLNGSGPDFFARRLGIWTAAPLADVTVDVDVSTRNSVTQYMSAALISLDGDVSVDVLDVDDPSGGSVLASSAQKTDSVDVGDAVLDASVSPVIAPANGLAVMAADLQNAFASALLSPPTWGNGGGGADVDVSGVLGSGTPPYSQAWAKAVDQSVLAVQITEDGASSFGAFMVNLARPSIVGLAGVLVELAVEAAPVCFAPDGGPVVAFISPPIGSAVRRLTPVVFSVTGSYPLRRVVVRVRFLDRTGWDYAYDGRQFGPDYQGLVNRRKDLVSPNGFLFSLLHDVGWPGQPEVTVYAIDVFGQEAVKVFGT